MREWYFPTIVRKFNKSVMTKLKWIQISFLELTLDKGFIYPIYKYIVHFMKFSSV